MSRRAAKPAPTQSARGPGKSSPLRAASSSGVAPCIRSGRRMGRRRRAHHHSLSGQRTVPRRRALRRRRVPRRDNPARTGRQCTITFCVYRKLFTSRRNRGDVVSRRHTLQLAVGTVAALPGCTGRDGPATRETVWRTAFEGEALSRSYAGWRPLAHDQCGLTATADRLYTVDGRDEAYDWTALQALDSATDDPRAW